MKQIFKLLVLVMAVVALAYVVSMVLCRYKSLCRSYLSVDDEDDTDK